MSDQDVIVTGAGPAGLFCALRCAEAGLRVLVLEKNRGAGKKLLVSGSGRCNITHAGEIRDFPAHYGARERFVKPALLDFTNAHLVEFFAGRGLVMTETDGGKIFPATQDARDVLAALLDECARHGVTVRPECAVRSAEAAPPFFLAHTRGERFRARFLVIATGGKSYPSTGSTGDGYAFARALGHSIVPPEPALAPLLVKDYTLRACAGISLDGALIRLYRAGEFIGESRGDVLFTHRGVSGPGVLDFSRRVHPGDTVRIALAGLTEPGLDAALAAAGSSQGKKFLGNAVARLGVPERLALAVLAQAGIPSDLAMAQLDKATRARVAALFAGLPLEVESTGGWNEAMVTRGGVAVEELDRGTMGSRLVKGLYFAGEVIDVDGDTGGYNLQFAFSSAALAAKAMTRIVRGSGEIH
jgi:predicted Rossmann fold flavoprotein